MRHSTLLYFPLKSELSMGPISSTQPNPTQAWSYSFKFVAVEDIPAMATIVIVLHGFLLLSTSLRPSVKRMDCDKTK